jgi:NAD(P)H-hydrate epimerase
MATDPPRTERFVEIVSAAGVIVDGFLGRGFAPPLREPIRGMVRALSSTAAPIIAIDLPSGVDPSAGVVGDVVSADVTVAVSPTVAGHHAPGTPPFLGDLYLSRTGRDLVRVHASDEPAAWAE